MFQIIETSTIKSPFFSVKVIGFEIKFSFDLSKNFTKDSIPPLKWSFDIFFSDDLPSNISISIPELRNANSLNLSSNFLKSKLIDLNVFFEG